MSAMPQIYPVIHHLNDETTLEQAAIAKEAGADGVFLISHNGRDCALLELIHVIQKAHPGLRVGINLLQATPIAAVSLAAIYGAEMAWIDTAGVSGQGASPTARQLAAHVLEMPDAARPEVFVGVAFKYQPLEPNPSAAACNALSLGFIPTTSGPATGMVPEVEKIQRMSKATGGRLAVASGMDLKNVHLFAPHLSHILVATGVSLDEHRFDFERLSAFIARARMAVVVADAKTEPSSA